MIAAYFYGLIGPDMVGLSTAVTIVFHPSLGVWTASGIVHRALVYVLLEDIGSSLPPGTRLIGLLCTDCLFLPKGSPDLRAIAAVGEDCA